LDDFKNLLNERTDPILEKMVLDGVPREIAVRVSPSEYPFFWYDCKKLGAVRAFERVLQFRIDPNSRLTLVK